MYIFFFLLELYILAAWKVLWGDWRTFLVGRTGVYSGNGPEVPEPLCLVIEHNAIHLGGKCAGLGLLGWLSIAQ